MLAYAEIHYRPRFMPSLLYARRPEILFDTPSHIDPGQPIPVFLIIKDAHRFPVRLETLKVRVIYESGEDRIASFPYDGEIIDSPIWWDAVNIMPEKRGYITLDPYVALKDGERFDIVHVDNYRGISHEPFRVYAANETLIPGNDWYAGDVHCHSYFTADKVEFGAPVEAQVHAARCMGLTWLAVTDHSYDLDDSKDDNTVADPEPGKWRDLHRLSGDLAGECTIIPGEEVTCRNAGGRNCHLLSLNSRFFLRGSGDSGERGFDNHSELTIGEAAAACGEGGGMACAAHPRERIPLTERLALNRGSWSEVDLESPGISALQVFNGEHDRGFHEGLSQWVRLLLDGRRIYLLGGSDSHGDMNRQRIIGLPLVSVRERHIHLFGTTRTVVRSQSASRTDIFDGLVNGRSIVTEGPFIELSVAAEGRYGGVGDSAPAGETTVTASFQTSPEYGGFQSARILAGFQGEREERELHSQDIVGTIYRTGCEFDADLSRARYIRAECVTVLDKYCMTNPIWIAGGQPG